MLLKKKKRNKVSKNKSKNMNDLHWKNYRDIKEAPNKCRDTTQPKI